MPVTPMETIREALQRIHRVATKQSDRAYMSIPADPARDADLILSDALDELERLRADRDERDDLARRVADLGRNVDAWCGEATSLAAERDAARLRVEELQDINDELAELARGHKDVQHGLIADLDAVRARLAAAKQALEIIREKVEGSESHPSTVLISIGREAREALALLSADKEPPHV